MFYLMIINKSTGRKTLYSINYQTAVFDSEMEAREEGKRVFGEDNANVAYEAIPMYR